MSAAASAPHSRLRLGIDSVAHKLVQYQTPLVIGFRCNPHGAKVSNVKD